MRHDGEPLNSGAHAGSPVKPKPLRSGRPFTVDERVACGAEPTPRVAGALNLEQLEGSVVQCWLRSASPIVAGRAAALKLGCAGGSLGLGIRALRRAAERFQRETGAANCPTSRHTTLCLL